MGINHEWHNCTLKKECGNWFSAYIWTLYWNKPVLALHLYANIGRTELYEQVNCLSDPTRPARSLKENTSTSWSDRKHASWRRTQNKTQLFNVSQCSRKYVAHRTLRANLKYVQHSSPNGQSIWPIKLASKNRPVKVILIQTLFQSAILSWI